MYTHILINNNDNDATNDNKHNDNIDNNNNLSLSLYIYIYIYTHNITYVSTPTEAIEEGSQQIEQLSADISKACFATPS